MLTSQRKPADMKNALQYDDLFLYETVVVFLFIFIVFQVRPAELSISCYSSFFSLLSWYVPCKKVITTQLELCDTSIVLD